MNRYSKITLIAIIAIVIPFVISILNIIAVEQLEYRWKDQGKFSLFALSNGGEVEFCNTMPYWMSFKKFEVSTFYDLKPKGVFTTQPLTINPLSYDFQNGTFHSNEFTASQYLFLNLDFEFSGEDIRIDPNKMYVLVNISTPIIGIIPYSTTTQYTGFDFSKLMNVEKLSC
ncbi:MAG: thr operon leader peptide [Nanoarchaeota archaeon]|nr:thr operon leader peptide [Nanoarchaeota archaeon]